LTHTHPISKFGALRSLFLLPSRSEASMHSRTALALCTVAAVCAGCKPKASSSAATAASTENLLRVTAKDFAFDAPDTIHAGLTTIRLINEGPSAHHIELVRLDQGKALPDFLEAMKNPGPPPAWATMIGGPVASVPGDSATAIFQLDPGTYAMICLVPTADGTPHVAKGMGRMLTVALPAVAAAEPVADDTVRLVDYDFQFSKPLTAGHHVLRVENAGQQWHEMVLARLHPGKTAMDFADWAAKGQAGPPPADLHGGLSGMLPGAHAFVVTDLTPGDYVLVCFFPDMKDGKPHVEHGMIKTITVS
jgi:plastocyanin